MRTVIVSDLHLGARNSQRAALLAFLRQTACDRLILNGDTIDHVNFRRFTPDDWAVLKALQACARARELVLLRGNHEGPVHPGPGELAPLDLLANLLGVPHHEDYALWVGRRKYLVLHGDVYDYTLNVTWVGHAADAFYRQVQRVSRPTARWLKMRVKHWGGVTRAVQAGAVARAAAEGYDGVVTGHTHFAAEAEVAGVHYLNTGCWTEEHCGYVEVSGARIRLGHWPAPAAVRVPAPPAWAGPAPAWEPAPAGDVA
jgi:UDP-2,3-diacylglucosamine pyrophosphatase LpxH